MRFLIVRTDIRAVADGDIAAAWADGHRLRDETTTPEPRRQIVHAEDRDAALLLARALATVGAVRAGKQRVKVLPLIEPRPAFRRQTGPHRHLIPQVVRRGRTGSPAAFLATRRPRRPVFPARDRRGNGGHGPGPCSAVGVQPEPSQPTVDEEQRDRRRRRQDQPGPVADVHRLPGQRRPDLPPGEPPAYAISDGSTRTGSSGFAVARKPSISEPGNGHAWLPTYPMRSTADADLLADLAQHRRLGRLARLHVAGQAGVARGHPGCPARPALLPSRQRPSGPSTPSCTSTIIAGSVRGQSPPAVAVHPGPAGLVHRGRRPGARRVAVPGVPVDQRERGGEDAGVPVGEQVPDLPQAGPPGCPAIAGSGASTAKTGTPSGSTPRNIAVGSARRARRPLPDQHQQLGGDSVGAGPASARRRSSRSPAPGPARHASVSHCGSARRCAARSSVDRASGGAASRSRRAPLLSPWRARSARSRLWLGLHRGQRGQPR